MQRSGLDYRNEVFTQKFRNFYFSPKLRIFYPKLQAKNALKWLSTRSIENYRKLDFTKKNRNSYRRFGRAETGKFYEVSVEKN
jgi:hypothetical protein